MEQVYELTRPLQIFSANPAFALTLAATISVPALTDADPIDVRRIDCSGYSDPGSNTSTVWNLPE
jgi:hypothetical protein